MIGQVPIVLHRQKQVAILQEYQGNVFVFGSTGTGKTLVVKSCLDCIWINSIEIITPRLLYERVIMKLHGSRETIQCDNPDQFLDMIQELKFNLVLDRCEHLVKHEHLLSGLFAIAQQSQMRLVLISHLPWTEFQNQCPFMPLVVYFEDYDRSQALDILSLDCPPDELESFYRGFVQLMYDTFYTPCRDLNELRYLIKLLYPKYIEPVQQNIVTKEQGAKLFSLVQVHIKRVLHSLYLRELSSIEWTEKQDKPQPNILHLPYQAKYLLIASFLASFNPPRLDQRFFTKGKDSIKKRKENGKLRQQLLGPKSFQMDRVLAIFYSITQDQQDTCDLYSQMATLISLGLLVRTSPQEKIDQYRLKCNCSWESIQQLSKTVKFDPLNYLYDFI